MANSAVTPSAFYTPIGRTDGVAQAAGYVGEYKTTGQISAAITGSGTPIGSLVLTPGEWVLSAHLCVDVTGSFGGAAYTIMAIATSSGNLSQLTGVNRMTYAVNAVGGNGAGAGTISNYRVSISSSTTYFLNAATTNNHTATGSLNAVRIA